MNRVELISVNNLPDGVESGLVKDRDALLRRYQEIRAESERLAAPLSAEDQQVQSMPDASPTKWHLAHVTWFFETFLLCEEVADYKPFHPEFGYLFNSYYEAVGPRHARPDRGLLTRPSCEVVQEYRAYVDAGIERLIRTAPSTGWHGVAERIILGLHHEQQHQELLLMDIKHVFSCNPLAPAYDPAPLDDAQDAGPQHWIDISGAIRDVGHDGDGFAFDNESPRHPVLIQNFRIAARPVTNGDYLAFIEDGGYARFEHWLMDGIETVRADGWKAPLYWREVEGAWFEFTLHGVRPLDLAAPVTHVSYYEAAAFASWSGHRLPTEPEWEVAASDRRAKMSRTQSDQLHPGGFGAAAVQDCDRDTPHAAFAFGAVWEWTQSAYAGYPGFRPKRGAIGEYNGKFMANQMVLRGGCCVTPKGHIRPTYRNFFYPSQRWMFSGIRLAADA